VREREGGKEKERKKERKNVRERREINVCERERGEREM
jgi:hypothetical protein